MTQTGSYTSQQMQVARQTDLQIRRSQTDVGNDFFFILLNSCSGIHGNMALAFLVALEGAGSTEEERVESGCQDSHQTERDTKSSSVHCAPKRYINT